MSDVNLSAMDLNLLVVVDAVLRERSATLAAARLHLTQSAVSNALGRARAVFGDPLVVRNGRGFALTPRAEAMRPQLEELLARVRGLLDEAARGPETTTRRFTIACTDAIGWVLLPRLLPLFEAEFPRARLRTVTLAPVVNEGLERADIDLVIGVPPATPPGCTAEELFADPMVAVVRDDHPEVRRKLRLETYARLPHAELALFGEPEDRVDRALAAHGLRRRIQVTVPHIATLPHLVAGSDRVATLIQSVARPFASKLSLRLCKPPVELPPLVVSQIWHHRRDDDAHGQVLRSLVRAAARSLRSAMGR
ncbi:MAG: LysR family transcriptional regulator [Myxococcales bacterium]|nr:LysR family transcriptional regulator [Myxococcales bacterium]